MGGSYVAISLTENCMLSKCTCTTAGTLQTLQVHSNIGNFHNMRPNQFESHHAWLQVESPYEDHGHSRCVRYCSQVRSPEVLCHDVTIHFSEVVGDGSVPRQVVLLTNVNMFLLVQSFIQSGAPWHPGTPHTHTQYIAEAWHSRLRGQYNDATCDL